MKEEKGPTINLKNINYINIVGRAPSGKRLRLASSQTSLNVSSQGTMPQFKEKLLGAVLSARNAREEEKPIFEREYFEKHVYMMRERMLEMFKNSDNIPLKDKKTMESEFHSEYKELRAVLREIKLTRSRLFADNNELHNRIERINDDMQRDEERQKKKLGEQRRKLEGKCTVGPRNANTAVLQFMLEKEKGKRSHEEKTRMKNEIKRLWDKNNEDIQILEEKLNLVKSKIDFVKSVLRDYYTNLFKQGTDTRGRGLIWIIQKLKKLGVMLDYSMFPAFLKPLEPGPQNYLEQVAELDLQLRVLKKKRCAEAGKAQPFPLSEVTIGQGWFRSDDL